MKSKNQSTTKGFAILSMSGLLIKILSLVYVPIQAAIVGNIGNNFISYGYRIYVLMFNLANAGLPSSISKMVARQNALGDYRGSKKIFKIAMLLMLVFGIASCTALALGAKWVATQFGQSGTYLMLFTLSPALIFTSINGALRGFFQGNRNMVPTAVSNVVEQVFNSFCTVLFIFFFYYYTGSTVSQKQSNAAAGSAMGTIAGAVSATAFLVFIYLLTKRQRDRHETAGSYEGPELTARRIIPELFTYIFPAIVGALSTSASDLIDAFNSIPRMMAGGLAHRMAQDINGQYTTQYQRVVSLATFVATALATAVVPAVSRALSLEDRKALKHTIRSGFKALLIFSLPCLMGLSLFAKPCITFIFFRINPGGNQFLGPWGVTNVLFCILILQAGVLIGIGRPIASPVNVIIGMVTKLVINFTLLAIPAVNMNGAAIGSAVGWLIAVILNERAIRSGVGVRTHYLRLAARPFVFSLAMAVAWIPFLLLELLIRLITHSALLANDVALLAAIALAGYLYAFLIIRSKTLTEAEISGLPMGTKIIVLCRRLRLLTA